MSVGTANSAAKPQVYDKVNIEMTDFSSTTQFPFKVRANLPGGGSADVSGKAGPINPQNAAKTPFEASIKVKDLDIAASGFVDPASGFGGSADLDGTLNSNGSQAKGAGVVKCEKLKLSPKGSPAPKAVEIKYADRIRISIHSLETLRKEILRWARRCPAHGRISDPGGNEGDEPEAQRPRHGGR